MRHPVTHILAVDDDPEILALLDSALSAEGYRVTAAPSGQAARRELEAGSCDLLLTDLRLPDLDGFALLDLARQKRPDLPVVVITSSQSVADAVKAVKQGALDYVQKPFRLDDLLLTLANALEVGRLRRESRLLAEELARPYRFENLVGDDRRMLAVYALVQDVAATSTTVLVTGESGTGKELIARAIHYAGPRSRRPLVKVNCVTLSESLLESELFGHEKGAFTGAVAVKRGLFEVADGGTLFLDEIGEMTPSTQAKLLQFLQDGTFRRVGGTQDLGVDVRVIAATNRDLKTMVAQGTFREDLYYRLNVFPISLPPLRERRGDISRLARHFLGRFAREMGKAITGFSPEALRLLETHAWPGNVRELENAIERAAVLCKEPLLGAGHLAFLGPPVPRPGGNGHDPEDPASGLPLAEQVETFERRVLAAALQETGGNRTLTARRLGLNRTTLLAKLKKHRLE
ncbi:MAG: sigma-54-dependent Fis family transcriptional regulator [Candidatus Zixiibacteriota bacterium]|nr:MAG: sigma-54-dependent Fis family transcriptional regulator [candidate division Zixibacteria bacterium]